MLTTAQRACAQALMDAHESAKTDPVVVGAAKTPPASVQISNPRLSRERK